MATVTLTVGTQVVFRDATDYGPAADIKLDLTSQTYVQLDMTSVADTAARVSTKVDLGASRAEWYSLDVALEFAATPVAGDMVEFYWAPSPISSANNGNPMGADGTDGAYPANAQGSATLAECVRVCQFIGNFICSDDATAAIQAGHVGIFSPAHRYGCLVVKNESGAAFHSDAVETHCVMTPISRSVA